MDGNCNGVADEDEQIDGLCMEFAGCRVNGETYVCVCNEGYEMEGETCVALPCTGQADWTACPIVEGDTDMDGGCFDQVCEALAGGDGCFSAEEIVVDALFEGDFEGAHAYASIESPCVEGNAVSGRDLFLFAVLEANRDYKLNISNNGSSEISAAFMLDCEDSATCQGTAVEVPAGAQERNFELPPYMEETALFFHIVSNDGARDAGDAAGFTARLEDITPVVDGDDDGDPEADGDDDIVDGDETDGDVEQDDDSLPDGDREEDTTDDDADPEISDGDLDVEEDLDESTETDMEETAPDGDIDDEWGDEAGGDPDDDIADGDEATDGDLMEEEEDPPTDGDEPFVDGDDMPEDGDESPPDGDASPVDGDDETPPPSGGGGGGGCHGTGSDGALFLGLIAFLTFVFRRRHASALSRKES